MTVVNVPGVEYTFAGNRKLVIPPLSLGDLEQLLEPINAVMAVGVINKEGVGTVIDAAHAALRRNYPDMDRAEVGGLLDLSNLQPVLEAIMNASGLTAKETTEGEAPAPSTGASSTPT